MIRVVLTGPANADGFYPYRIEWTRVFVGVSKDPLGDAAIQLHQAGLMDDTVIALFDEGEGHLQTEWKERTTVGQAAQRIKQPAEGEPLVKDATGAPVTIPGHEEVPEYHEEDPTIATPAKPKARKPRPRTPPKQSAGKGQAHAKPKKSAQSHPKRKPVKSAGRRGSGRGR